MCVKLYDYQLEAINKMRNGCILCGGVGSGKSRTGIGYYFLRQHGDFRGERYVPMESPKDLYIITTARKRDTNEWNSDLAPFLLSPDSKINHYGNKIFIDSWNNIKKYADVENAFFIFDEQRVVGYGAWTKSFLKIAKSNEWILLSATPGDCWSDYIPVFIANGYYKNKTEFSREHIVYSRFSKYPKVDRYVNTGLLIRHRNSILVNMKYERPTISHQIDIYVSYDTIAYKDIFKNRWNYDKNEPIANASELCYQLRKVVNSDPERLVEIKKILQEKKKVIIFYNYDYELEFMKLWNWGNDISIAEWNGHKHESIPKTNQWIYLVQYSAGNEGWNCIETDTIIFYSQNYSYKIMIQAAGRIDRLNTPFTDLYFYHFKSRSGIDLAISKALNEKKKFNEDRFING